MDDYPLKDVDIPEVLIFGFGLRGETFCKN